MKKTDSNIDKRVIKTKKAIINAFMSLMVENHISSITVKAISEKADINRKTFYSHYPNVYAILDEIEDEMIKKLMEFIDQADLEGILYNPYVIFEKMTVMIYEDQEFFGNLLASSSNSHLIEKVDSVIRERLLKEVRKTECVKPEIMSIMVDFVSAGSLAVYKQWFAAENSMPLEELTEIVGRISFEGMNSFIDDGKCKEKGSNGFKRK